MTATCIFIEPSDVWLFRDGRPFAAGEQGRAVGVFPPTPRTVQGALRSARLSQSGQPWDHTKWSNSLRAEIGQPDNLGALRLRGPLVARRVDKAVQPFYPLPLDVVLLQGAWQILSPRPGRLFASNWHPTLQPLWPTTDSEPEKFDGAWLDHDGMLAYLCSDEAGIQGYPDTKLFSREQRLGIQIDSGPKRPPEGMLYQVEFIRLETDVGLLVEVAGVTLPGSGVLQLGGEARAGCYETVAAALDLPQSGRLTKGGRPLHFKLYLATPAIFANGWLPGWLDPDSLAGAFGGVQVQLVAAAVGKPKPIGGRDIARRDCQRAIRRAVPAGSVYFFETQADAQKVLHGFDGQCLSDAEGEIGFGLSYVGGW